MKHTLKRFLSWMLVFCMVLAFLPAVHASSVIWEKVNQPITADLTDRLVQKNESADLDPSELVRVSIVLEKPSAVQAGYATMGISANPEAMASTFGYLYHDDVSFNTVGSPGSYGSAFTVASVENDGAVGTYFTASGRTCFYQESSGYGNRSFSSLDPGGSGIEYAYVLLDAPGNAGDY